MNYNHFLLDIENGEPDITHHSNKPMGIRTPRSGRSEGGRREDLKFMTLFFFYKLKIICLILFW